MDYDYYRAADLEFPTKPKAPPCPDSKSSAGEFRVYADALETYEKEKAEYEASIDKIREELSKRQSKFSDDLRVVAGAETVITDAQHTILYDKAYEEGHSGGYPEIHFAYEELLDFYLEMIRVVK
jgi:hypothetical protein